MLKLLPLLLLLAGCGVSKNYVTGPSCGGFPSKMEKAAQWFGPMLDFYKFQPGDTVLSIGAESLQKEIYYSAHVPQLQFYLENISPKCLNPAQLAFAIQYYDSLLAKKNTASHTIVMGSEKTTGIKGIKFKSIIIELSYHEFSHPDEMLEEIKTLLRPGGRLFIMETVANKPGVKYGGCKHPMNMRPELLEKITLHGFNLEKETMIPYINNKKMTGMLFAFRQ